MLCANAISSIGCFLFLTQQTHRPSRSTTVVSEIRIHDIVLVVTVIIPWESNRPTVSVFGCDVVNCNKQEDKTRGLSFTCNFLFF